MKTRTYLLALACMILLFAGCNKSDKPSATAPQPAVVDHHVDEVDLNTIKLTERAEQRLGIRLVETVSKEILRKRTVGGEVTIPPGNTIVVSAPVTGTLSTPSAGDIPLPGSHVESGQVLFDFKPMLSPERDVLTPAERVRVAQTKADVITVQIEAERQIESAKVSVDVATVAFDRAVQLLQSKAGSQRSVDEANANLRLAREAQKTAEARYEYISKINLDEEAGDLETRTIQAPIAGVLQRLDVAAGEMISAGAPMFSVITTDHVWIRVPVYVGLLRKIDTDRPAMVAEFGQRLSAEQRTANYIAAPPSANPVATTVDIFYELDNQDEQLRPGQKLAVTVPLRSRAVSLIVPFNAVLYDIHGGAWVYVQIDNRVYARQRVSVEYTDDGNAVLASGPPPGTKVVTDGAAELFGTEFGVGH